MGFSAANQWSRRPNFWPCSAAIALSDPHKFAPGTATAFLLRKNTDLGPVQRDLAAVKADLAQGLAPAMPRPAIPMSRVRAA